MKTWSSAEKKPWGTRVFGYTPLSEFDPDKHQKVLKKGLDSLACFNDRRGRDFFSFLNIQEVHEAYEAFLQAKLEIANDPFDTLVNTRHQLPAVEQIQKCLDGANRFMEALKELLAKINETKQYFVNENIIAPNQRSPLQKLVELVRSWIGHIDPEPEYKAVGNWASRILAKQLNENEQKDFLRAVEGFEGFVQTLLREANDIVQEYKIMLKRKNAHDDLDQVTTLIKEKS